MADSADPKSPFGDYKLLVVEDEDDLQRMLIDMIRETGIQCEAAFNGIQALELIAKNTFAAALCDIYMPRMNGLQFLLEVRKRFINLPVVILTGNGDIEVAKTALRLGATDFLEKPVETEDVKAVVMRIMEIGVRLQRLHNTEATMTVEQREQERRSIEILKLKNLPKEAK